MNVNVQRGRGLVGTALTLVVAIVVALAVWYYLQGRDGSVRGAWSTLKENSEDAATTAKVKTALMLSKHVSGFDIKVTTKQGLVTLGGQVPSEEVKAMAGAIAQDTSSVKQLQNNLAVDPSTRPNLEASRLSERVADLEIKTMVGDAIRKNPELTDRQIELDVKDHKVTLNGNVENDSQKGLAQQLAWGVQGVVGVTNNLSVTAPRSGETHEDKLAKRVEFELFSTKAFPANTIEIHSQDGVVTLGGTVSSLAEKLLAEKIAQSVNGVRKVVNNLGVLRENDRAA